MVTRSFRAVIASITVEARLPFHLTTHGRTVSTLLLFTS